MAVNSSQRLSDTLTTSCDTLAMSHSTLHSSFNQSANTSKTRQYSSASDALSAYISDFEKSHVSGDSSNTSGTSTYLRTVEQVKSPKLNLDHTIDRSLNMKPILDHTIDRSLNNGNRSMRNDFQKYKVKKLIDRSYREILRADSERHKAMELLQASQYVAESSMDHHSSVISNQPSDVTLDTEALVTAPPCPSQQPPCPSQRPPYQRQTGISNRLRSDSLVDLSHRSDHSKSSKQIKKLSVSYHAPSTTHRHSTPAQFEPLSPPGGRPAPSWIQELDVSNGHPAPSWIQDLETCSSVRGGAAPSWIQELDKCSSVRGGADTSSTVRGGVPSWIQDLDTCSTIRGGAPSWIHDLETSTVNNVPLWVQDLDVSNISTITQNSLQQWIGRHNSKPSDDDLRLLKRYGSTSDLLMSNATDWTDDDDLHVPKTPRLMSTKTDKQYQARAKTEPTFKRRLLTSPEKRSIKSGLYKWTQDENRLAHHKDDSVILSSNRKMPAYGSYSRDDSDITSVYSMRRNSQRPLQAVHDLGTNTLHSSYNSNRGQLKRAHSYSRISSTNSDDLLTTPPKTRQWRYTSKPTMTQPRRTASLDTMDTELLLQQPAIPINDTLPLGYNSSDVGFRGSRSSNGVKSSSTPDRVKQTALLDDNIKSKPDLNTSPLTEDVLDGDRSWEKNIPILKPPRHIDNHGKLVSGVGKSGIIDKFLEDCLQSDQENDSPRLTGGEQPGPVETLKKMLFTMQSVAAVDNASDNSMNTDDGKHDNDDGVSCHKDSDKTSPSSGVQMKQFEMERGRQSLQRAMEHLSRLKTLVQKDDMDTRSDTTSQPSSQK